ncbi:MAG: hypothetical protein ACRENP_07680 [Longimicrobiales bacterium]
MPSNLAIGAFVLGGVLLLISVLRGGFKLFGAEVTGSAGGGGRVVAFVAGVALIVTGLVKESGTSGRVEDPTDSTSGSQPPVGAPAGPAATLQSALPSAQPQTSPATAQTSTQADPIIRVEWRAARDEMMAIVATLSDQEKMQLGFNVLMTGQDVYAIHVRITNIGTVPVAVAPEHLRLTYSGTDIPLVSTEDAPFLQSTQLQPNRYTEGVLTFKTAMLIAGAVLTSGRLSYHDAGVRVTFSR